MSRSHQPSPLQSLEATFRLLSHADLRPLSLDGSTYDGLPARLIPLTELSAMFAHPSFRERWATRDAVLRTLAVEAQAGESSSVVALAGMLLAGLRRKASRLRAQFPTIDRDVIESELLSGLNDAVAAEVPATRVAARLLDRAFSSARTQFRVETNATRHLLLVDDVELAQFEATRTDNPEGIVRAAVADGAISTAEADLILAVHFDGCSIREQAETLGISYRAACQRLRRAKNRLLAWMFDARVPSRRSSGGASGAGPRARR